MIFITLPSNVKINLPLSFCAHICIRNSISFQGEEPFQHVPYEPTRLQTCLRRRGFPPPQKDRQRERTVIDEDSGVCMS